MKGSNRMKNRKGILILIAMILLAGLGTAFWLMDHHRGAVASTVSVKKDDYYYCAMHPWFHQDHPGNCGICGMTLIKRKDVNASDLHSPVERKVKYWVDSMNPAFHQDHPGKAPDGMDLVAVYNVQDGQPVDLPESLKGLAPVDLSPFKQQLIGLRTATVAVKPIVRVIRTVGKYAGGSDNFSAEAGDFAENGKTISKKSMYLVADIYALDVPYVKKGQTAWVSAFSGSGPRVEGQVAQIYPYDGTQSRVRRVRINVLGISSAELFANVEIEASSQPLLSVPVDAVMTTGLHRYVFVKKSEENFVPTEITVGVQGDNELQVTDGLSEGETVVEGANFMVDADSKLEANFAAIDAENGK
jgi:hypothetical protein